MKNIKKIVLCNDCQREPGPKEKIDDWQVAVRDKKIDLTCPECYNSTSERAK